ncbi:zinc finger MIZ domain-containing protein 1-like isoform X2 [Gigantopelta aegis]|uniref:zinc finger MIZ domain-containing protein 1-like isoform X2 n=1 Tax=Gigantopelta aegis TaxID=1735272 RepID=UPI001B88B37E|nr:zinc finger MIZ domain-containing protein 1-like isoform X2 [Gigantopelta aegis]
MTLMHNDMDRHITQTNDRLLCIKQHLLTASGFQNAARELLEWCSDTRAFQRQFEDSLMSCLTFENTLIECLTVVSKVAAQPGYDLDLGYRLLAVCASHKEMFTPKSAGQLTSWCEELGRSLLLRHQKSRPASELCKGPPPGMHPQMQNKMQQVHPGGDPSAGWGGPNSGQPGLSVVTTVWGVTPTTQTAPFTHNTPGPGFTNTTMSGTHFSQQPQGFPGTAGINKGAPYPGQMMPQQYRREPRPSDNFSGYPPTPNTPGSNPPGTAAGEYSAPPAALTAAAFVAAAATATATATATASMVALQEQQNQQQQMNMQMNMSMNNNYPHMQMQPGHQLYNNQYPPGMQQRPPGHMPMGQGPSPGPGPMPTKVNMPNMNMYNARRAAPYPNPHQFLQAKRGQPVHYPNGTQVDFVPGPQSPYNHQQFPGKPQFPPTQQPLPSPTYGPPQGMRPAGPGAYPSTQNPYMTQNQYPPSRPPGQAPPGFNQFSGQQPAYSPIHGNPTPPMTPGAVPPGYSTGDIKPNFGDFKPQLPIKKENDELRLTFPVRDGVVLPPFRLEHNLAVSNHVFHLRESVYQTLMWRSDLELQLKCFHHEDRQMNTNWPASVTVSVNANPLTIERGENKSSHKPLYLKEVCQPGRNTIQITVTACCCSHLFVLQLVHRPSIRSVLQGLMRKRLLPAEHCITKIKRNFTNVPTSNSSMNGEDGVEQTAIKVSLKCPITYRRITLPARGHDCKHIQCFDLEYYLQLNCERGTWRCPVCNKTALLEGLEIDQYIWGILTNLNNTEFEEVTIDQTASWKPVPVKTIKEEEPNTDQCSAGRWIKAMSPASMQMPTMNNIDLGPRSSPYSLPAPGSQEPHLSQPLRHPEHAGANGNHMPQTNQPQIGHQNGGPPLIHAPNGVPVPPNPSANDCHILSDLNFDPATIIDGDAGTQSGLDLLPENLGDPIELLSYLGPPERGDSANQNSNVNNGTNATNTNSDDLLALFES